jgi:hypothetical protein
VTRKVDACDVCVREQIADAAQGSQRVSHLACRVLHSVSELLLVHDDASERLERVAQGVAQELFLVEPHREPELFGGVCVHPHGRVRPKNVELGRFELELFSVVEQSRGHVGVVAATHEDATADHKRNPGIEVTPDLLAHRPSRSRVVDINDVLTQDLRPRRKRSLSLVPNHWHEYRVPVYDE